MVIDLPDESTLVFDAAPDPDLRRELELWATVPEEAEGILGDPGALHPFIEAGPLLAIVLEGMIGDAAWDAAKTFFPLATGYFRRARKEPHPPANVEAAIAVARPAIHAACGHVEHDLRFPQVDRNKDGSWNIVFEARGVRGKARIHSSGYVTQVWCTEPSS